MAEDFTRYAERWSAEDHASFEALCFHRVDEVDAPYTALLRAPEIENHSVAAKIVNRACEAAKEEIARAWANWEAGKPDRIEPETGQEIFVSGCEVFAYAIAKFCEGPGRVPALISASSWKHLDFFECNIMQARGGALNSYGTYYSSAFSAGLVWDSFWFFEDAFGEESHLNFTTYHLTKSGLDYCLWRYPERAEQLRKAEEARARG